MACFVEAMSVSGSILHPFLQWAMNQSLYSEPITLAKNSKRSSTNPCTLDICQPHVAFLYPLMPFILRRKFMYCSCSWCKPSNFHGYNLSRALHLFLSLVVFSMDSNFKPNQRRVNNPTSNSLTMSTAGTLYRGRTERNKGSDIIKTGPTNCTRTLKRIK